MNMAFRMTGRVLGALARERNDVQPALRKVWKAHEHIDGLVRNAHKTSKTSMIRTQSLREEPPRNDKSIIYLQD